MISLLLLLVIIVVVVVVIALYPSFSLMLNSNQVEAISVVQLCVADRSIGATGILYLYELCVCVCTRKRLL